MISTVHAPAPASCPACARERRPDALECPFCGVIYARHKPQHRPPQADPQQRSARAPYLSLKLKETLLLGLAQALEAGLSPHQFARGPLTSTLPPQLSKQLIEQTESGAPLSSALRALGVLDETAKALLAAAEAQGKIPGALRALAQRIEAQRQARAKLFLSLIYPGLLLSSGILIRPIPKLVMGGPEAYLAEVLPPLLLLVSACVLVLYVLPRLDRDGRLSARAKPMMGLIPPLGAILWHQALAAFAETFNGCITAGLSIRQALPLAAEASGHDQMSRQAPLAIQGLDEGLALAEALARIRAIPPEDRALISHGELVGKLDEVLPRIAAQHKQRAKTLTWLTIGAVVVLAVGTVFAYLISGIMEGWSSYIKQLDGLELLLR